MPACSHLGMYGMAQPSLSKPAYSQKQNQEEIYFYIAEKVGDKAEAGLSPFVLVLTPALKG